MRCAPGSVKTKKNESFGFFGFKFKKQALPDPKPLPFVPIATPHAVFHNAKGTKAGVGQKEHQTKRPLK